MRPAGPDEKLAKLYIRCFGEAVRRRRVAMGLSQTRLALKAGLSRAGVANIENGRTDVAMLGLAVSDPPTQAQLQAVVNKLDELILALRR